MIGERVDDDQLQNSKEFNQKFKDIPNAAKVYLQVMVKYINFK